MTFYELCVLLKGILQCFTCQEPGPGLSMGRGRLSPPKHLSCPPNNVLYFIRASIKSNLKWAVSWNIY